MLWTKNGGSISMARNNKEKTLDESLEKDEMITDETIEDPERFEDEEFEEIEISDEEIISLEGLAEELKESNRKLNDENVKLQNEIEAVKDRLLRLTAEYENFRKRTAKEKEGIYTDACEDVLKNMLPVMDNLERAMIVEGSVEDIKKGIDMTVRQFKDSLGRLQVEEIPSEGEFDPNLHNAVMHIEDSNVGQNQIVEVFQKGYKKGNKVLRHSMVKVAN
jgi:molecular chaperone GrpE